MLTYALCIPRAIVDPGATVCIKASPQVGFRPESMVVPADFADVFFIKDIKMGRVSQLVRKDRARLPINARLFEYCGFRIRLKMDECPKGGVVSVAVINRGETPRTFWADVLGPMLEEPGERPRNKVKPRL